MVFVYLYPRYASHSGRIPRTSAKVCLPCRRRSAFMRQTSKISLVRVDFEVFPLVLHMNFAVVELIPSKHIDGIIYVSPVGEESVLTIGSCDASGPLRAQYKWHLCTVFHEDCSLLNDERLYCLC